MPNTLKELDCNERSKKLFELRESLKDPNNRDNVFNSQDKVAEALGVSANAYKGYERANDVKEPFGGMAVRTLFKICQLFNVSADYLLGLSEFPSLDPDVKAFCRYTGLNEETIELLKEFSFESDVALKAYLECREFWDFLSSVTTLISRVSFIQAVSTSEKMNFNLAMLSQKPELYCQTAYLDVIESLRKLLVAFCNYYEFMDQLKKDRRKRIADSNQSIDSADFDVNVYLNNWYKGE